MTKGASHSWQARDIDRRLSANLPVNEPTNPSSAWRTNDLGHYHAALLKTYVSRLRKAFTPDDFRALFATEAQLGLFDTPAAVRGGPLDARQALSCVSYHAQPHSRAMASRYTRVKPTTK